MIRGAKSIKIDLKETKSNKALTAVSIVDTHEAVNFYSRTMFTLPNLDTVVMTGVKKEWIIKNLSILK